MVRGLALAAGRERVGRDLKGLLVREKEKTILIPVAHAAAGSALTAELRPSQ